MQPALYRAERPEVFEEIIGQKHIVRILQNQIRTGTVSQAYLFAGTHGTGKTSTARILAKAVNCIGMPEADGADPQAPTPPCGHCENCEAIRQGRFPDCIELDAASNNGVDDLRAIIEMVKYPPAVGKYKVYIIDEVHMLSTAAENAFLKTLEEPPEHAIFILATTDPQKVRSTIRSRCMQLNFRRVTEEELIAGMERICSRRGINASKDALATIASRADGSVRDALSILEQCTAAGDSELSRQAVLDYTGAAGEDFFLALTSAVIDGDAGRALIYIDEIAKRGKDTRQILKDWLRHFRDLMIVRYVSKAERIVGASEENISRLRTQAERIDAAYIERAIRLISEYINLGRYSERPRILLETAAVRLAAPEGSMQTGITQQRQAGPAARGAARSGAAGSTGSGFSAGGSAPSRGAGASRPGSAGMQFSAGRDSSGGGMPQMQRGGSGSAAGSAGTAGSAGRNDQRFEGADMPGQDTGTDIEPKRDDAARAGTSAAPSSDADGRPAGDALAEMIAAAPRERTGNPAEMWDRIVREISASDRSFMSLVGRNSSGESFDSGELSVTVTPVKMRYAEDKAGDISRIAKMLYGGDVFVTLRAGEPGKTAAAKVNAGIPEAEANDMINQDINVNDVIEDVESLFGIRPTIEG